ncbi:MAG: hypothetical protein COC12_00025 [Rhodobacteraceae bacterium]|nr:MAG: hypothetical protein COC12_00025 [Paracoccaceae bacterium]
MTKKKVLILGFSVTAEGPGFVESAHQKLGENAGFLLSKVGIGGVHPQHLKFLIEGLLQDIRPDFVVFEISTSAFRMFHKEPALHQEALDWILYRCQQHGIGAAFLDLPRNDVNSETDWVTAMHRQICQEHGIPHHPVPQREKLLKDVVHPTPAGCIYYADHLLELLRDLDLSAQIVGSFPVKTEFGACDCVTETTKADMTHMRGGYVIDMAAITPERPLTLPLRSDMAVVGLLFLMGPLTGKMRVQVANASANVFGYDEFCYYERVSIQIFPALRGDSVTILQLPEVPDTVLKKGDKELGPRLGHVGKILYERPLIHT